MTFLVAWSQTAQPPGSHSQALRVNTPPPAQSQQVALLGRFFFFFFFFKPLCRGAVIIFYCPRQNTVGIF